MAYNMTIHLSEQEYVALTIEANRQGKQPEAILRELMVEHLPSTRLQRQLTEDEFIEKQYREGKILNIPTRRRLTKEEKAERERLGQIYSHGKPMSEMVIEDRGPY